MYQDNASLVQRSFSMKRHFSRLRLWFLGQHFSNQGLRTSDLRDLQDMFPPIKKRVTHESSLNQKHGFGAHTHPHRPKSRECGLLIPQVSAFTASLQLG